MARRCDLIRLHAYWTGTPLNRETQPASPASKSISPPDRISHHRRSPPSLDLHAVTVLTGATHGRGLVVGPTLATIENFPGEPGGAVVGADPRLAGVLGDAQGAAADLWPITAPWAGMPPIAGLRRTVGRLAAANVGKGIGLTKVASLMPEHRRLSGHRERHRCMQEGACGTLPGNECLPAALAPLV